MYSYMNKQKYIIQQDLRNMSFWFLVGVELACAELLGIGA